MNATKLDCGVQDALFTQTYPELRKLAHARLYRGGRAPMVDTTTLVHESYLRMFKVAGLSLDNRSAFFAYASRTMRSVIVDAVRERKSLCQGGDLEQVTLNTQTSEQPATGPDVERVHEALLDLEQVEPRLSMVAEMRYFGGYCDTEIAQTLGVTIRTVGRDWEKARLLLCSALA